VKQNLIFVIPLSLLPFLFVYVSENVLKQLSGQRLSFRVEPNALHTRGPNGHESYEWQTFTSFDETTAAFLLYRKRKVAHIIPRRAFRPDDEDGIRTLLAAQLEKRKTPVRWRRNLFWAIALVATVIVWIVRS